MGDTNDSPLRHSGTFKLRNRLSASLHAITPGHRRSEELGARSLLGPDEEEDSGGEGGSKIMMATSTTSPATSSSSDDEEKVKTPSKRERRKELKRRKKEQKRLKKLERKEKAKDATEDTQQNGNTTESPSVSSTSSTVFKTDVPTITITGASTTSLLTDSPKIPPRDQRKKKRGCWVHLTGCLRHFFTFDHISHLKIPLLEVPLFLVVIPFTFLACMIVLFYLLLPDYSIYANVVVTHSLPPAPFPDIMKIILLLLYFRHGSGVPMPMPAY